MNMNKGFVKQLVASVVVIVLTLMLWRSSSRLTATLEKKKKIDAEEALENYEEKEDKDVEIPDESKVKQGENRYYYLHQHQDALDDKTKVSSYGWSDSKKSVSIYITDNAVTNMKEEQLKMNWTNMSLSMNLFTVSGDKRVKSLVIPKLFQEITDVMWEANNDTLTIILAKAQEIPWTSLNGAARKMENHIEYDDAFYD